MATRNNILGVVQRDPKDLKLVQLLAEKTRQGKIAWSKSATGLTASVAGAMQLSFVLRPNIFSAIGMHSESWELFTVREGLIKDILKVENKDELSRIILEGSQKDPLIESVDELFRSATQTFRDDIDKAIEKVEKL